MDENIYTATAIVAMHAHRLALANGQPPLKLWQQLQDRVRACARTSASAQQWSTALFRTMRAKAPDATAARAIVDLVDAVPKGTAPTWLEALEDEHVFIAVLARDRAIAQKKRRQDTSNKETAQ